MKRFFPLLIACAVLLSGCSKITSIFHGDLPSSISIEGIKISEATGLAIMNVPVETKSAAEASTKAAGDMELRLCIITPTGTKLAEFKYKVEGNTNNPIWQETSKNLSFVPQSINDCSSNFILLSNIYPVNVVYNDCTADEHQQLDELMASVSGSYLLRKKDGALFKCPLEIPPYYFDKYSAKGKLDFSETTDKKTIVVGIDNTTMFVNGFFQSGADLVVIKDKTSELESVRLNGQLVGQDYLSSYLLDDNHIVLFQQKTPNGAWTFDMDLNPTFVDFTDDLKAAYNNSGDKILVKNGSVSYLVYPSNDKLDKLYVGKIIYKDNTFDILQKAELEGGFFKSEYSESKEGNIITLMCDGSVLNINTEDDSISLKQFPDGFPTSRHEYNEDGVAYKLSSNLKTITCYDSHTMTKSQIDVNWSGQEELVSSTIMDGEGCFTVSGVTRVATFYSYLIEKKTGKVTLIGSQEYTAPAVTSYCQLNG